MLAIRLARMGSKKRPFFRLVVADSRSARDSRFVEILGHYNPRSQPARVRVNRERFDHWIKAGARPSDTVRTLLARHVSPDEPAPVRANGADQTAKAAAPAEVGGEPSAREASES
ncbi:MAG: 30S ribosomal protein S16 [Acidobacteria bacterium]|nr:30S ribosomal protein S16 [Acidobacteriota bacterium]MBI3264725.1 30S ribosomal protein S16 [Acidobacteriota bacterium]